MTDHLSELFRTEAERVPLPHANLDAAIDRGRKLTLRRRATVALASAAVVGVSALLLPSLGLLDDVQTSLSPSGSGVSDAPKFTTLSISAEDETWGAGPYFVAISFATPSSGGFTSSIVCFALPKWVEVATIYDASGNEVAAYPGALGIGETDSGKHSCQSGDETAHAHLALAPEEHRLEIQGRESPISSDLEVQMTDDTESEWRESAERRRLEYRATQALDRGDLTTAEKLGRRRLQQAPETDNWDHGNAIHYGHLILGHVALRNGDLDKANRELLLAGRTTGSPQLDSFGPNMSLARDLLRKGQQETVLEYLDLIAVFWDFDEDVDDWASQIRNGTMPDFGMNLEMGWLGPRTLPR
ncbi:MAG: hypothetical protein ACRDI3_03315 [Actinomycetota bacterium]